MRPGILLTARDRVLMRTLVDMRCLTIEQLQRLHFPSLATARRRIRRLEAAGYVARFRVPALAAELVRPLRTGISPVARPGRRPSPLFLEHALAINDFRIALLQSLGRRRDLILTRFACDHDRTAAGPGRRPEPMLAGSTASGGWPRRHLPDAAFVLQRGDRTALFVLEIDRGSETVGREGRGVGKLVSFYLRVIASGELSRFALALGLDTPPTICRVLLVTTGERRIENIRRTWGNRPFEPEVAKRLVWMAGPAALAHPDLLGAPWRSLDPADRVSYRIDSRSQETPA